MKISKDIKDKLITELILNLNKLNKNEAIRIVNLISSKFALKLSDLDIR